MSVQGQGGITIGNAQGDYNPVVWDPLLGDADGRVSSADGVILTLWYGEGIGEGALTQSIQLDWHLDFENFGPGYFGYYQFVTLILDDWEDGDVYSFQVRASGNSVFGPVDEAASRSIIWQEQDSINFVGGIPPGTPGLSSQSVGFTVYVPEPSTFALAGLGAAAMMIFRRRRS